MPKTIFNRVLPVTGIVIATAFALSSQSAKAAQEMICYLTYIIGSNGEPIYYLICWYQ